MMRRGVIICLGKALKKNGTPEKMLLNRCDKAIEVYRSTGFPIICSGADTVQVGISEAQVMADYIHSHDASIPIIFEEKANNTVENFQYCFKIAENLNAEEIILVTCEHHMPRASYVCRAVLNHLGSNLGSKMGSNSGSNWGQINITTESAPDVPQTSHALRQEEHKKIFTTPSYLVNHFEIEPPAEIYFSNARQTLEKLVQISAPRRKSFGQQHLESLVSAIPKTRS